MLARFSLVALALVGWTTTAAAAQVDDDTTLGLMDLAETFDSLDVDADLERSPSSRKSSAQRPSGKSGGSAARPSSSRSSSAQRPARQERLPHGAGQAHHDRASGQRSAPVGFVHVPRPEPGSGDDGSPRRRQHPRGQQADPRER